MAKHRITDETPTENQANSIIRRVLECIPPSANKHDKDTEWRRKLFHATYTDFSFGEPTRHVKVYDLSPTSYYGLASFVNRS